MKKSFLFFVLCLCLISCSSVSGGKEIVSEKPKHVFLIAFDGMSANSIKNSVDMPVYHEFMKTGSYTLKNRSILPSSSACNWASMFMGAGPELHGFNTWGSKVPDLPSRVLTEHGLFPDVFYLLKKKYPESETGHIYEWEGMRYLVDTLSVGYLRQTGLSGDNTDDAVKVATDYIKSKKPLFCSIIFAEPDGTGHGSGWETKEYYDKLHHLDSALGKIKQAVIDAGIFDESVFILAADHGGKETGHGGPTMDEMETPLVICGKGIKKNYEITESTMVFDVAATICYMLDLDKPQVWIGRNIESVYID